MDESRTQAQQWAACEREFDERMTALRAYAPQPPLFSISSPTALIKSYVRDLRTWAWVGAIKAGATVDQPIIAATPLSRDQMWDFFLTQSEIGCDRLAGRSTPSLPVWLGRHVLRLTESYRT